MSGRGYRSLPRQAGSPRSLNSLRRPAGACHNLAVTEVPSREPVDGKTIRAELASLSAEEFVSHYILDRVPWIFPDRRTYVNWKTALAKDIDVDPHSILVVGSSCVGLSLSPAKDFSMFHGDSDIDVAIVSSHHFDIAWRWLRSLGPADSLAMSKFEHEMFKWHRKNLVFDGTIATDQLLARLPFGPQWTSGLSKAATRSPTEGREVKGRIYRDFESLRSYHEKNVKSLAAQVAARD